MISCVILISRNERYWVFYKISFVHGNFYMEQRTIKWTVKKTGTSEAELVNPDSLLPSAVDFWHEWKDLVNRRDKPWKSTSVRFPRVQTYVEISVELLNGLIKQYTTRWVKWRISQRKKACGMVNSTQKGFLKEQDFSLENHGCLSIMCYLSIP